MTQQSFTTSFQVSQTPQEVYAAINNVRGWWSENIEGSTDQLNSAFDYAYKDIHLCKIKVIELEPAKRVVWHVLDNYFNFIKDTTEWKDNKIVFDITKKGGKTELTFTNDGLVPHYECYDICYEAWTHYVTESLKSLIETGKGKPTPKEGRSFNAELVEKHQLD